MLLADAGEHVMVLSADSWDWSALCDVQIGTRRSSRAFLYQGANEILWVYQPGDTVVAEVPAATGSGMILFSQLDIRDRLDNRKAEYDPVAERILVNILRMLN